MEHRNHPEGRALQPHRGSGDSDVALAAAKVASQQTIEKLFGVLGVNVADYDQMQELRDDIGFLRRLRSGSVKVGGAFVMAVAGAAAIGVWEAIKTVFHFH